METQNTNKIKKSNKKQWNHNFVEKKYNIQFTMESRFLKSNILSKAIEGRELFGEPKNIYILKGKSYTLISISELNLM